MEPRSFSNPKSPAGARRTGAPCRSALCFPVQPPVRSPGPSSPLCAEGFSSIGVRTGTSGLTPAKLQGAIDKKANAIKEKLGVKDLTFRVEVVDGKVKLKARAQKAN